MSTTVHIPERLLERVDARAKALGKSRNRLIVEALEASLALPDRWPAEVVRMLETPLDAPTARAFERSLDEVRRRRRNRKKPPKL